MLMIFLKAIQLLNIYFFLTGLFKNIKFNKQKNKIVIPNEEKYRKLIYIVLDGLRFDYTVQISHHPKEFIHNKMTFYSSLKKFHALSVCGIPTSTTCRITDLMTGTPTNFLELTKTFIASRIQIDNLVEQVYKKESVSFYGDRTWIDLFPFLKDCFNFTMDPYNKKDLEDTENKIVGEMLKNLSNSNYTFCHLIALDSFGHVYGLNNKIIEDTLKRYDEVIKKVYEIMDKETLLVVVSDHGVTDKGSHGGVDIKEMSSVVSFISKGGLNVYKPSEIKLEHRKEFLKRFYDCSKLFFKTNTNFSIVHQDDILPTVCYLLGIPIPINVYGNFIHELVNSKLANFYLFMQKKINFGKEIVEQDLTEGNYRLTNEIYNSLSGNEPKFLIFSFLLSSLSLLGFIRIKPDFNNCILFIFCFYVSFSVMAVINEDLFWLFSFLLSNCSLINILCGMFYLGIDKHYGIYTECVAQYKQVLVVDSYFKGNFNLFYLLVGFIFLKETLKTKREGKNIFFLFKEELLNSPTLILSLYKYLFVSHFTPEVNLSLLLNFLSPKTLCVLLFRPIESIFILYVSEFLEVKPTLFSFYTFLNLSIGYSGMIKQIQCLNYEVLYVFSPNPSAIMSLFISLFYFIYPRFIIFKRFLKVVKKKEHFLKSYLMFDCINLFMAMC